MKKGKIKIKVKHLINLFVYTEDIFNEFSSKSIKNKEILERADQKNIADLVVSYYSVSEFTNFEDFCNDLTPENYEIINAFREENFYLSIVYTVFHNYKEYFNSIEDIIKLNNAIGYLDEENTDEQLMKKLIICENIMNKEIFVEKEKMQPVFDFQKNF